MELVSNTKNDIRPLTAGQATNNEETESAFDNLYLCKIWLTIFQLDETNIMQDETIP